ncbi:MAG: High-affnity carbon uptake protein Hat/HatR [Bacteroidota bacterium]
MTTLTKDIGIAENPFPGLRPFKIDESHLFFGREGQSDEVLLKLSKNRFVGVIGPSGSGKSSFVYCGVLPILYGGFLTDTSPDWDVIVTRPGAGPIDNLAEAILQKDAEYMVSDPEEQQIKKTIITTLLKSSSLGLVEALMQSRRSKSKNFLILVDQFEELFRFKDSTDTGTVNETLAFVNLLMEAINYLDVPIYIGITMRSDFIGDCAQFPDLTKKLNDSHYLIPQMTREQKRRAIEGPVAVGGATITSRLTQQLLNDLGDNPDQLPILQHSLMRTWSYWQKNIDIEGEELDLKHYEAIGTMSEALSLHANEAYDELDESEKEVCESLFKAITEKRGENFGIRRPTRLGEIAAIADVGEEELIRVIDKFRDPGRSLLTPPMTVKMDSKSMIDISHESLMRIWVRLKNWVDDEADAVQMYMRLSEAAAMYQVGKAGLWRPPDLQLALNWKAKHNPTLVWGQRYHPAYERTMIFLEYSRKEFETEQRIKELQAKRRLRIARITALVMGGLCIVALGFLVFAFIQRAEAIRSADVAQQARLEAEEARDLATTNEKLAKENEKKAIEEERQANIARADAEEQRDIANAALADAQAQRIRAEKGEADAKRQTAIAVIQKNRADSNATIAQANERRARAEKERADKLRFQAIAKAMAVKSTQFRKAQGEEQVVLKSLLAQQAYNYNTQYEGNKYDNDVYYGLYEALRDLDDPMAKSLGGHKKSIRALTSSPSGNHVYSAGTLGKVLRWSVNGNERLADTLAMARGESHLFRSLAVNSDDNILVAGGNLPENKDGSSFIEIYDLSSGNQRNLSGFDGSVWKLIFQRNSNVFYALDNNGKSIKRSDLNSVTEVISSVNRINDFSLSQDGQWLIAVTQVGETNATGEVVLYDLEDGYSASVIHKHRRALLATGIGNDNSVAIGDVDGLIKVFKLFSNDTPSDLIGHTSEIDQIEFSADGRFIATASKDKTVKLWNRKEPNTQPINLKDHPTWVWTITFSPDNNQILAGTQESVVRSWPTTIEAMSDEICGQIDRNLSKDEWTLFVSEDIEYEKTCENIPDGE